MASTRSSPSCSEEAHLLDADEVPALERGHHHGHRLDPPSPEIAATVRGDHQAHEVLDEHGGPQHEERADEEGGGRAVDVGREDRDADDEPGDPHHRHRDTS